MTIWPFTKSEAIALCIKHQNLVGEKYVDDKSTELTVFYIIAVPCPQNIQMELAMIYSRILNNESGYSLNVANDFIQSYTGNDFDVLLISGNDLQHGRIGRIMRIQLLLNNGELEYGFNLKYKTDFRP